MLPALVSSSQHGQHGGCRQTYRQAYKQTMRQAGGTQREVRLEANFDQRLGY